MNAIQRRQLAHERHRAFFANVTGLRCQLPYLSPTRGLVFQAKRIARGLPPDGVLVIESCVNDPTDFSHN